MPETKMTRFHMQKGALSVEHHCRETLESMPVGVVHHHGEPEVQS